MVEAVWDNNNLEGTIPPEFELIFSVLRPHPDTGAVLEVLFSFANNPMSGPLPEYVH